MNTPILKIKRDVNRFPSLLNSSELAVDLGINKLYIGNSTNVAIPISAEVSDDITLGGVNSSDNKIPTQFAVKTYVDTNITPSPPPTVNPRDTFLARFTGRQVAANPQQFEIFEVYGDPVIEQSPNMGILIEDISLNQFGTGFFQTTKTSMLLSVNYNLVISSVDSNAISLEGANLGVYRTVGMRVINKSSTTNVSYHGMKTFLPAIGSPSGLPTLVSGNAILTLPKFTPTAQWELQLVYRFNSNDPSLAIGDLTNGVNDPIIANGCGLRVEMIKLFEVA